MVDYESIEQRLSDALHLQRRPVAVTFGESPPAGVPRFAGTEPSGCSFWRLAAAGRTFYTVPGDHYNCPIGSYTHNIPLPPDRARELDQTLTFMAGIGYLRMEEVPGIPRLPQTPEIVIYAPLGDTPVHPDVVLFAGRPGRLMLLQEAALRGGVGVQPAFLGRPTCMALPGALASGVVTSRGVSATGCTPTWGRTNSTWRFRGGTWPGLRRRFRPSPMPTPGWPSTTAGGERPWRPNSAPRSRA